MQLSAQAFKGMVDWAFQFWGAEGVRGSGSGEELLGGWRKSLLLASCLLLSPSVCSLCHCLLVTSPFTRVCGLWIFAFLRLSISLLLPAAPLNLLLSPCPSSPVLPLTLCFSHF